MFLVYFILFLFVTIIPEHGTEEDLAYIVSA